MSARPLRSRSGTGHNRLMLQLLGFIVDCPDPMKLAAFYSQVTGRAIGPDGYGWQVYTDPAGHPFCLCRHEGVTWTGNRVVWR